MLVNGQAVSTAAAQQVARLGRGWSYGDGLFETIAFYSGHSPFWSLHMQRLQQGCDRLQLQSPDSQLLMRQALQLAQKQDCVIRISVIRASGQAYWPALDQHTGTSHIHTVIERRAHPEARDALHVLPAKIQLSRQPRLAGMKHISRLEQVLAAAECAAYEGVDELLLSDQDGLVIESISSNVVAYMPDIGWITPELTQCGVAGVMREWLLSENCMVVQPITLQQLYTASALALVNSVRGVEVVASLQEKTYPKPELCLPLAAHIRQHINTFLEP